MGTATVQPAAGGLFTGGDGGLLAFHLARWDGAHWVALNNTAVPSVSTLAVHGNDLYIAGYLNGPNFLMRWDGTNFQEVLDFPEWVVAGIALDGIGGTAMAIDGTNIYLSGNLYYSECGSNYDNCTNCLNVLHFDGAYARVMGTGLNTNATAIAVAGTNVFFSSQYLTNAGGVTVKQIARWDGYQWYNVGGGVTGSGAITSLAGIGNNLYAAGSFTNMGGTPARHIAKWDGSAWTALGSGTSLLGVSGTVNTLTAIGSDLYVGGSFIVAGGKPSYYIARWNENTDFDTASIRLSQPSGGNNKPFKCVVTSIGVPTYVIDTSTNLSAWTPLRTNSITPYDFIDSSASGQPNRFYKGRPWP